MKHPFWFILALVVAILLGLWIGRGMCKEIDLSITGSVGYGQAEWGSGLSAQPGGTLHTSSPVWGLASQVKYNRWKLQPTIEFNYRWVNYDFSTPQAPIQKMEPRAWSILAGVTVDLGKMWYIYGLIGYTQYQANVSLQEFIIKEVTKKGIIRGYTLNHGSNISFQDDLFAWKVGAYKLWPLWMFKVGPEFSLQGWNKAPGWSKCREGKELAIQPNLGLRIQW